MGPSWDTSGADRTQLGPMLDPWTLLSGILSKITKWKLDFCLFDYMQWKAVKPHMDIPGKNIFVCKYLYYNWQSISGELIKYDCWALVSSSIKGYVDKPHWCWMTLLVSKHHQRIIYLSLQSAVICDVTYQFCSLCFTESQLTVGCNWLWILNALDVYVIIVYDVHLGKQGVVGHLQCTIQLRLCNTQNRINSNMILSSLNKTTVVYNDGDVRFARFLIKTKVVIIDNRWHKQDVFQQTSSCDSPLTPYRIKSRSPCSLNFPLEPF